MRCRPAPRPPSSRPPQQWRRARSNAASPAVLPFINAPAGASSGSAWRLQSMRNGEGHVARWQNMGHAECQTQRRTVTEPTTTVGAAENVNERIMASRTPAECRPIVNEGSPVRTTRAPAAACSNSAEQRRNACVVAQPVPPEASNQPAGQPHRHAPMSAITACRYNRTTPMARV